MSVRVQNHPISSSSNMFHHGLVKILIMQDLGKLERTWSHFLFWGGFKVNPKSTKKRKRNRVVETFNSTETKPLFENKSRDGDEQTNLEEITST